MKKLLDLFCKRIDEGVGSGQGAKNIIFEIVVRIGDPMNEILETADEKECDIIIVGSHGKGLLKRNFLGSVSKSVVARTRKPVLVVPMVHEDPSVQPTIDNIVREYKEVKDSI